MSDLSVSRLFHAVRQKSFKHSFGDRRVIATISLLILLCTVPKPVSTIHTASSAVPTQNHIVLPFMNQPSLPVKHKVEKSKKKKTAVIATGPAQANPSFATYPSWSQNFVTDTSGRLDSKYWDINQGPPDNSNDESEYYTNSPTNLHIKNGALSLEATEQTDHPGYAYTSARVDTQNKKSFLYGRIDITAEVPIGAGVWPAAWLLPANNTYEDLSPANDPTRYMNGGEIDLIEEVGYLPNTEYGIIHSLSDEGNPNGVGTYNTVQVANGNDTYNLYSLLWTPTSITFEVNNVPFYTYNKTSGADYTTWPFNQPFYLILNVALGGSWGGGDIAQFPGNGINNAALPASMNIRSIYYYPLTGR